MEPARGGLPKQRTVGRSMVPGKWESDIHLLLLAAEGVSGPERHPGGDLCRGAGHGAFPALRAYRSSHGGKRCADPGLCESGRGHTADNSPGSKVILNDFNCSCPVYIACGYTDLRRGIDGLATLVKSQFQMDPFQRALFLFCGRRRDRLKALYWEGAGFLLLYKRLEAAVSNGPGVRRKYGPCPPAVPLADGGTED